MKINTLVITSSGFVNENLYGDLGKILASHIPVSGKITLFEILKSATKKYTQIYVTIDRNQKSFIKLLKLLWNIDVIESSSEYSLIKNIDTIFQALPHNLDKIDIIFGDSLSTDIFSDTDKDQDIIYVSSELKSSQFTSICRNTKTNILNISDENLSKNIFKITGSFKVSDLKMFRKIFAKKFMTKNKDAFWETWIDYDKGKDSNLILKIDKSWIDVGHIDNYFEARRKSISESSRHFNSITIEPNLYVKKQGNKSKIELEKKWYREIPENLERFMPVFIDDIPGSYKLEYISAIPANEIWISENEDHSYWTGFVNQLNELQKEMHSQIYLTPIQNSKIKESKKQIYKNKFEDRVEMFLTKHYGLFNNELKINGMKVPNLNKIISTIEKASDRIMNLDFWSVIHGDLCFSNLIYDRRRNKLNLLDPRGSFGDDGIFGDPIYDLAKLSHSINGDYDYFTSDLFYLSRNDSSIELFSGSPKRNMISREIARDFLENSIKKYSITIDELRLIEASLFLSAAHLHPEGNRGLALFTNGILIVNDVL